MARRSTESATSPTVVLTSVTLLTLALLPSLQRFTPTDQQWWLIPATLLGAALVTPYLARETLPRLWPPRAQWVSVARVTLFLTLLIGIMGYVGIQLLGTYWPEITIGDRPGRNRLQWILYQFLYVAVAEEYFFRGFVQRYLQILLQSKHRTLTRQHQGIIICTSGFCFALAHLLLGISGMAALTFIPGLVFAWSYLRTQCLLVPILLHGWANGVLFIATLHAGNG